MDLWRVRLLCDWHVFVACLFWFHSESLRPSSDEGEPDNIKWINKTVRQFDGKYPYQATVDLSGLQHGIEDIKQKTTEAEAAGKKTYGDLEDFHSYVNQVAGKLAGYRSGLDDMVSKIPNMWQAQFQELEPARMGAFKDVVDATSDAEWAEIAAKAKQHDWLKEHQPKPGGKNDLAKLQWKSFREEQLRRRALEEAEAARQLRPRAEQSIGETNDEGESLPAEAVIQAEKENIEVAKMAENERRASEDAIKTVEKRFAAEDTDQALATEVAAQTNEDPAVDRDAQNQMLATEGAMKVLDQERLEAERDAEKAKALRNIEDLSDARKTLEHMSVADAALKLLQDKHTADAKRVADMKLAEASQKENGDQVQTENADQGGMMPEDNAKRALEEATDSIKAAQERLAIERRAQQQSKADKAVVKASQKRTEAENRVQDEELGASAVLKNDQDTSLLNGIAEFVDQQRSVTASKPKAGTQARELAEDLKNWADQQTVEQNLEEKLASEASSLQSKAGKHSSLLEMNELVEPHELVGLPETAEERRLAVAEDTIKSLAQAITNKSKKVYEEERQRLKKDRESRRLRTYGKLEGSSRLQPGAADYFNMTHDTSGELNIAGDNMHDKAVHAGNAARGVHEEIQSYDDVLKNLAASLDRLQTSVPSAHEALMNRLESFEPDRMEIFEEAARQESQFAQ